MDRINSGKIGIGSMSKLARQAAKTGKMCAEDLLIFHIINELRNDCQLSLSFEVARCLDERARYLVYKSKDLCNYRERRYDTVSSNIRLPKFNQVVADTSNKVVANNSFSTISDNEELIFTTANFTTGLTLDSNLDYGVNITSLPMTGTLVYNNAPVVIGQTISLDDISNSLFKFVPLDIDINYSVLFNFQICII